MADFITVTALNRYVKNLLERDAVLTDVAIRGEISNFTCHLKTGHCYLSLKDSGASVKAVMFRGNAQRLAFQPENGMQVLVRGRVSLFERDGAFQVYIDTMVPDGIGAAAAAFEALKAKLEKEGLFDISHKKAIPAFPKTVGVVTSKTGAALQDILKVVGRRWPFAKILLAPVNVQGANASLEIAAGIRSLDEDGRADVMIVGRGGGSAEDLWVFNHEWVARAAYSCKTPLISAVGHEIDFTILDFVADLRAPTPSAGAEVAVPDALALLDKMKIICKNIQNNVYQRYKSCYNELNKAMADPAFQMQEKYLQLFDKLHHQLAGQIMLAAERKLILSQDKLCRNTALADSLSPYRILSKGYAVVTDEKQQYIKSGNLPQKGDTISVKGRQYTLTCLVKKVTASESE